MRVYIAGKISGIEQQARQNFKKAEILLAEMGLEPVNPFLNDFTKEWDWYMKRSIKMLLDCDAIYLLNNYKDSKGALLEKEIAEKLDYLILYQK